MSMYNALFGRNPASGVLLAILGLKEADVGRFRDAYVTEENGEPVIAIYTRNGGGNRECSCEYDPKFGTERCKHHTEEYEDDELVYLEKEEREGAAERGLTPIGFHVGSKQAFKTGRKVTKTRYVCENPCSADCYCTGCFTIFHAHKLDGYIRDEDDDFDNTYCTFFFRPPNDDWRDMLAGMVREGAPDTDWTDFLAALNDPPADPETRPQRLATQLIASLKG